MGQGHARRVGTDQKAVVVIMGAALVMVVMEADLRRVTRKEEVLAVVIEDQRILMPVRERVQKAVGIFFGLIEINQVELVAIGKSRAEQADRAIRVIENETAKVAVELLRAGTDRHEIVIGTQIGQLDLAEPFLQSKV